VGASEGVKRATLKDHHINDAFGSDNRAGRGAGRQPATRRSDAIFSVRHQGCRMQLPRGLGLRSVAGLTPVLAASLALAGLPTLAAAEGKLEAHYRVTVAGLPIGSGAWVIDVAEDRYTMAASGQVSGLLKAFSSGEGTAAVRGTIQGTRAATSGYAMHIKSRNKIDEVRMALAGGALKELAVEPPVEPDPSRVPLTEAHKRGFLDPISAGMIPAGGPNGLGPEACQRTIAVFDGRQRYDLALAYKRMDKVKAERGYDGPVVVCSVSYRPLGGHDPERQAIKFLRDSRDIEMWFAPIAGTRFLGMYRIVLPTLLGNAVLNATRFVSVPRTSRAGAANAKTQ
jgi:uncharacterized protein DUF3108